MGTSENVRSGAAPPLPGKGFLGWVCTNNPFYVLSAGLFFGGLWVSFGQQVEAGETWAFMGGLIGYTLLLATTAYLLVRHADVWDDVRTVLLLVVLMFLATSVTFDGPLVANPPLGILCYLGGLGFAVAVSETLFRGIRLRLPALFRMPYYLILSVFFLYPLVLRPLIDEPFSEALLWTLFGFATVAGLAFLTLIPAIRRGRQYVRDNGSPWPWPLYPWTLFFVLALAVPGRAYLLCWSMHLTFRNLNNIVFGLYFLVPFGLVLAILLVEIGLQARRRRVLWTALLLPALMGAAVLMDHRGDPLYRQFVEVFRSRLGGDPLFMTIIAAACFYAYAAVRRVPLAFEALLFTLLALSCVGNDSLVTGTASPPQPLPLFLLAALLIGYGLWKRSSWRFLAGVASLVAAVTVVMPDRLAVVIALHLGIVAVLGVGAFCRDQLGQVLRLSGALLVLLACAVVLLKLPPEVPTWMRLAYPPIMASLLAGYGWLLRHRPSRTVAAIVAAWWAVVAAVQGYRILRLIVLGLDYLAISLLLFALAVLISLGKSGLLTRWFLEKNSTDEPAPT